MKHFLAIAFIFILCGQAAAQDVKSPPGDIAPELDDGTMAGTTPISLVEAAYLANRRGDYKAAIDAYTTIIQRRGLTRRERAISYLLRGEAKRDDGQLDEAILDFTRALKQWPGYPQAHFFRGRVYEMQNKLIEAYADMSRAASLDLDNDIYKSKLSILKHRMKASGLSIPQDDINAPQPLDAPLPDEKAPPLESGPPH